MKFTTEERLVWKIDQLFKEGIDKYELIEEGDKLLIGLSGGKDSLALVELLGKRSKIFKPRFTVHAVHIKMSNIPYTSDEEYLRRHCEEWGVSFHVTETSFDPSTDTRKSPCFLCSWNRRKALFTYAQSIKCNKIVLGHHQDDMIETLLMNMTFQGAVSTMPPKLKMNKFDMTIIRPMCMIQESLLIELASLREYKKQVKNCPYEKDSHRSDMKAVVRKLEEFNPQVRASMWKAMTNIQEEYLPPLPVKR